MSILNQLVRHVESWGRPRILVLGDLMLDRYVWGDAERVSPEAPVVMLRAESEEARLGGAASVAALLQGLEAEVHPAGVIGNDANGRVLRKLFREESIEDSMVLVDESRRTTTKERYLGRTMRRGAHQILRVDFEDQHGISRAIEERLIHAISEQLSYFAAVLVSDYGKGVCIPRLLNWMIDEAHSRGLPILVDPARGADYSRYRGATLIKPNRIEAEQIIGRTIHSACEALAIGRELCARYDFQSAVVTLDRDGMAVISTGEQGEIVPAEVREVCDITGAGDMVLAALGLCTANRLPLSMSARLATAAAGLEVQREGVAVVPRSELLQQLTRRATNEHLKVVTLEEITKLAEIYRKRGQTIVFTNGCFDLLHTGHVTYLQEAAALGDVLVVAINSDASVRRLKGPTRPILHEADRAALLSALSCVDHVLVFDEDTPHRLLMEIRPQILVKGGTTIEVVGREIVESYGGRVYIGRRVEGVSTTEILAEIKERISIG